MAALDWCLLAWKKYAVFSGRAGRREYWMFHLGAVVIAFVVFTLSGMIGSPIISTALRFLWRLAVLVPTMAVGVRRFHDMGRGAGPYFLIFIPSRIGQELHSWQPMMELAFAGRILGVTGTIILVVFCVQKGTRGNNRYGPEPGTDDAVKDGAGI